jgi:Phage tail lysozyme
MTWFTTAAPRYVHLLQQDLAPLEDFQACGIMGNAGHESGGLVTLQEVHPRSGKGGLGWFQWTGSRRVDFNNWCAQHGMFYGDTVANYGFLLHELNGAYAGALKALRLTKTLEEATKVFEQKYEMAGVVSMDDRIRYAKLAQTSYIAKLEAGGFT